MSTLLRSAAALAMGASLLVWAPTAAAQGC
jgi:hypothetical protein